VSDIQRELQAELNSITQNDFHSAFQACENNDRCIFSQGDYFDGDDSQNYIKPSFIF
jgi:hypothetical protein